MALSLTEQLDIVEGISAPPEKDLTSLVSQAGSQYAINFLENHKIVDEGTHPDAAKYLSKMLSTCNQSIKANDRTDDVLKRTMVAVMGNTSVTAAQVSAATQAQWENFLTNNIDEVFEYIGGVRKEEKAEYLTV